MKGTFKTEDMNKSFSKHPSNEEKMYSAAEQCNLPGITSAFHIYVHPFDILHYEQVINNYLSLMTSARARYIYSKFDTACGS